MIGKKVRWLEEFYYPPPPENAFTKEKEKVLTAFLMLFYWFLWTKIPKFNKSRLSNQISGMVPEVTLIPNSK